MTGLRLDLSSAHAFAWGLVEVDAVWVRRETVRNPEHLSDSKNPINGSGRGNREADELLCVYKEMEIEGVERGCHSANTSPWGSCVSSVVCSP